MAIEPSKLVDTIREPEYTGENRCVPCTIANVVIAAVVSVGVAIVTIPGAVGVFVACVFIIYVRGYIVPGTPTITKRYFPDRILRWFDKEPLPEYSIAVEESSGEDLDVESALRQAGVLEAGPDAEDYVLNTEFRDQWYEQMRDLDREMTLSTLARMLDVPVGVLSTEDRGASYAVKVNDATAGKWESLDALAADMAAERVLSERVSNWEVLPVDQQSGLLRSLRVYLDECPQCGDPVELTEETVESCCRSRQVIACNCDRCDIRLFEVNASNVDHGAG